MSPNLSYDVSLTTTNSLGTDVQLVSVNSGSPITVLPTTNGGTALFEWGSAAWSSSVPSIVARFDYLGAPEPTECHVSIVEQASGFGVLDEISRMQPLGCMDPSEPNNACPVPSLGSVLQGTGAQFQGRLTLDGDKDVLRFRLQENLSFCSGGSFHCAEIFLLPAAAGQAMTNETTCGSPPASGTSTVNHLVIPWTGSCFFDDSRDVIISVTGPATCEPYTVSVLFHPQDTPCL